MKDLKVNSTLKKIGLQRGRGLEFLDANAINDKAVYCYAVFCASLNNTLKKPHP